MTPRSGGDLVGPGCMGWLVVEDGREQNDRSEPRSVRRMPRGMGVYLRAKENWESINDLATKIHIKPLSNKNTPGSILKIKVQKIWETVLISVTLFV